ncbi:MAG: hypothetical protein EZS28_016121 [Streblomastix strix]|uniref:Uncharacterized protein n=1 Tax=Streblomastix strix TaxID=222440 RepID=A0A5J4W0H9_9EUKA|nr:MAG: hypothetical protein EZS28_016121 [Streblomastix strix]
MTTLDNSLSQSSFDDDSSEYEYEIVEDDSEPINTSDKPSSVLKPEKKNIVSNLKDVLAKAHLLPKSGILHLQKQVR